MESQENIVRSFLRSEYTWVVSIIVAVFAFVNSVVLPIQKLQIQIADVQEKLIEQSSSYATILKDHAAFVEQQKNQDNEISSIKMQLQRVK